MIFGIWKYWEISKKHDKNSYFAYLDELVPSVVLVSTISWKDSNPGYLFNKAFGGMNRSICLNQVASSSIPPIEFRHHGDPLQGASQLLLRHSVEVHQTSLLNILIRQTQSVSTTRPVSVRSFSKNDYRREYWVPSPFLYSLITRYVPEVVEKIGCGCGLSESQ